MVPKHKAELLLELDVMARMLLLALSKFGSCMSFPSV